MGSTLLAPRDMNPAAAPAPVPVAFLGRTSTLVLQDPAASLARQHRSVRDWLPPGWFIAASFWDIESGGLDLEQRGHGSYDTAGVGVPRDGGLADLLAEAASPHARFAAVVCEDIERSGRDTFNALRLERELARADVPLFATDEPAGIAGASATTVLVRRVKQGVAEWFRLQIKEKSWKGLREHSLAGWNIGPAPYGYTAERVPHPVPYKAAQGHRKTRLILNPRQAPAVAAIFAWRTRDGIGLRSIASRLNADPAAYPPPDPAGWTHSGVNSILRNPKYTGHMVFGRRTSAGGRTRQVPPDRWLWSPEPTHPAIITRATWDAAQAAGPARGSSRDDPGPSTHPQTRRTYILRGRVRCRACQHRMSGITRARTAAIPGQPAPAANTYYMCPPGPHRDPGHPKTISIREDTLTDLIRQFFAERIFGPERAALLADLIPAGAAELARQREQQAAALHQRLHQIDTAEDAHAREIEALTRDHHAASPAAITALRTRLIARFTELEDERAAINAQLAALTAASDEQHATDLLNRLPLLGDILDHAPARLQAQLYDAFSIQVLYRHHINQVSIHATITDTTPQTLAAIIADAHPEHAPTPASCSDLVHRPIRRKVTLIMASGRPCDDGRVAIGDGPGIARQAGLAGERQSVPARAGSLVLALVIAFGCGAATASMAARVLAAREYFGGLWIPVTAAGVVVGLAVPALAIRAWRVRRRDLSGALFAADALALAIGFMYFAKLAASPAGRAPAGGPSVVRMLKLAFAALTATSVAAVCAVMLALTAIFIWHLARGHGAAAGRAGEPQWPPG